MPGAEASAPLRERPLVSVVIPHLNQLEAAGRCLASLAAQTWPAERLEIIFVDNGSKVDLSPLKADWPEVKFLAEPQPGPGLARNRGVAAATGDILAFIDADCRADPRWIEAAVAGIDRTGGPVGGDVRIDFLDEGDPTPLESYEAVFAYRQRMYIERQGFSGTGNLAMVPADFTRVGPFGGIGIAEDRDWGQRARAAGRPLHYVAGMIVHHPARTSLEQLQAKWRRHIAHDLAKMGGGPRWAARMLVVAASALPHSLMLLTSPRIRRPAHRLRGLSVLWAIRLWRVGEMRRQAGSGVSGSAEWNRS